MGPDDAEPGNAGSQQFEEPVSSAAAAEKGNAGEEPSAAAGIEKPKQKRRRRTTEEVWGSGIVDVALQLHNLLPKMAWLQE